MTNQESENVLTDFSTFPLYTDVPVEFSDRLKHTIEILLDINSAKLGQEEQEYYDKLVNMARKDLLSRNNDDFPKYD